MKTSKILLHPYCQSVIRPDGQAFMGWGKYFMEIWKLIPDAHGYEISNWGRIRRSKESKPLSANSLCDRGYPIGKILINGKRLTKRIHVLMRTVFFDQDPNRDNPKMVINHKDGNKANNRLENLEIVTRKQNIRHAMETGLMDNSGQKNGMAKLTNEQAEIIKSLHKIKSKKELAIEFSVSESCIESIFYKQKWNT